MAKRGFPGTLPPMRRSYAVMWQEADGSPHAGKLELRASGISLEGRNGAGPVSLLVPYRELLAVTIAPRPERLSGQPTLVLDRRGAEAVRIASVGALGIIPELAERVASMRAESAIPEHVAVVVRLREGKRDTVERLLHDGPPFDPEEAGLERHEVFVSDEEAIFVFDAVSEGSLQRLLTDPSIWASAASWHDVVAGPPRIAKTFYAWEEVSEREDLFFAPTPGPGDSDGGDIYSP
jgi:hypothetical protein